MIVLLGADKQSTRIVCNALRSRFLNVSAVLEGRGSRLRLLLRRRRRLGVRRVIGQALFVALVLPILRWRARDRIRRILVQNGLDASPIAQPVVRVASVNSEECRSFLRNSNPAVVVVNGTRIIEPATLGSVQAPFINMHAGITPLYRGGHGAYWALAEGRPRLVGTTIHVVDSGIDTGPVLAQTAFQPTREDSFATYPYLHLAAGIPDLLRAVAEALEGRVVPLTAPPRLPSQLRYHPTAWEYLRHRLKRGVR
jgi:folate-dependent phosphoribosylglycinamide formyltransferase PurN